MLLHETKRRGEEGDLNPQTSHALGGNPTASALGTDTDGSGGNQYEPANAASGTSPLATSAAQGRPKWETRESATGGGGRQTRFRGEPGGMVATA